MSPTADDAPLHEAITRSAAADAVVVQTMIQGNVKLCIKNVKGRSPLSSAIQYGPNPIAKIMLESQEDVDAEIFEGWTSLRHVFCLGSDIYQLESSTGVGGRYGWSQVQHAVRSHVRTLTDLLLERGVDLNRPSAMDGWTPLIYAAKTGDLHKLRQLLTRENDPANVHLRDREGKSALWWAVYYKKVMATMLLVEHGTNVSEVYDDESTPLLQAVRAKDSSTTQLLLSLGADAKAHKASNSKLSTEAVRLQDRDTAWALLNAGARLDDESGSGRSALLAAIGS